MRRSAGRVWLYALVLAMLAAALAPAAAALAAGGPPLPAQDDGDADPVEPGDPVINPPVVEGELADPPRDFSSWRWLAVLGAALVLGVILWAVMRGAARQT